MDGERNRPHGWPNPQRIIARAYDCPYCGNRVSAHEGYGAKANATIAICPHCRFPTFFGLGPDGSTPIQVPESLPGWPVSDVPSDVRWLYEEARKCVAAGAYTASVLTCRKMLIDMAVSRGDTWEKGKPFVKYVEYLAATVFSPDYNAGWLARIRVKGNQATHELGVMSKDDALLLIEFIEMMLRVLYEYPNATAATT